ncbi:hypothetical protein [Mycobacterium sp. RTGN5]|uniref:hypothetical protein n=1 Tax=Mycobacterium sp. RTGN5 TaxID=3016522 RepID=UPI0029C76852|nr:hypothetical protein [Mycobacterium sp. RTGN5]
MADRTGAARTKFLLAVAGGGAVLAMAGLTVVFDENTLPNSPMVAAPILPGPMTQGDTVTTTIAPAALATAKARPAVKAKHFGE